MLGSGTTKTPTAQAGRAEEWGGGAVETGRGGPHPPSVFDKDLKVGGGGGFAGCEGPGIER